MPRIKILRPTEVPGVPSVRDLPTPQAPPLVLTASVSSSIALGIISSPDIYGTIRAAISGKFLPCYLLRYFAGSDAPRG